MEQNLEIPSEIIKHLFICSWKMKSQMRLYNDLSPIMISLSDYVLRASKYICGCCWLLENASHVDSYIKTPSLQSYFEK